MKGKCRYKSSDYPPQLLNRVNDIRINLCSLILYLRKFDVSSVTDVADVADVGG